MRRTAALLALLLLPACGLVPSAPPQACTEIGCESAVSFELGGDLLEAGVPYRVHACLDDRCEERTLEVPPEPGMVGADVGRLHLDVVDDRITLLIPDQAVGGTRRASLAVTDADGRRLAEFEGDVELERSQPNGPGCPPVCWFASVRL